jgi:RNA polymerase sigma-70 factor (ECF subfamily)
VTGYTRPLGDDSDATVSTTSPALTLPLVESYECFYVREFPGLVALARALTGSAAQAEEIAQDAMIATYRRWNEVSAMEHPAAWTRRVCSHISTSVVRRTIVEARTMRRLRSDRPQEAAELDEPSSAFWSAVRGLPRRQAQAIALYYLYSSSVSETAAAMGCTEGSVKTHLARGRATLAARLEVEEP